MTLNLPLDSEKEVAAKQGSNTSSDPDNSPAPSELVPSLIDAKTRKKKKVKKDHDNNPSDFPERIYDIKLPFIGHLTLQRQIQFLFLFMLLSLIFGGFFVWLSTIQEKQEVIQSQIAGDALMHSQQIAKAVPNAILGNPDALKELQKSRNKLISDLNLLTQGGVYNGYHLDSAGPADLAVWNESKNIWLNTDKAANTILTMKKELTDFAQTIKKLTTISAGLFELSEEVAVKKLQHGGSTGELAAFGQLLMLTSRLERGVSGFLVAESINPETTLSLKREITTFSNLIEGLLNGSDALQLMPVNDPETRKKLTDLKTAFADYQRSVSTLLSNLQNYMAAKHAGQLLLSENEDLRLHLIAVQTNYRNQINLNNLSDYFMYLGFTMAFLAALSGALVLLQDGHNRAKEMSARRAQADMQMRQAQKRESEAKHANDQNQAAILRLMNELQEVADGDLTIHATVSEDITGAIADSVNYTVEELRGLVGRVTTTAEQVTSASNQAEGVSAVLLSASQQQSREIKGAGEAILAMVDDINDVSRLANESVEVARKLQHAIDGVKLADRSDTGLAEIRRISNQLAKLIQHISQSAQQQKTSANGVAQNIQQILSVTEQTQNGAQQTAQSIHELSGLAQELKNSVSRFRVTV